MCRFPDPRELDGSEIAAPDACLYCVHCTATTTVSGVRACSSCAHRLADPEDLPRGPVPGSANDYLAEATRRKIDYGRRLLREQATPPPAERYQPVDQTADGTYGLYDRMAGEVTLTGMTRAERDATLRSLNAVAGTAARTWGRRKSAALRDTNTNTTNAAPQAPPAAAPTNTNTNTAGGSSMLSMAEIRAQGEAAAASLDLIIATIAEAQGRAQELVGIIAPVAERATESVQQTAQNLDTALGGGHEAVHRLRHYLSGLSDED